MTDAGIRNQAHQIGLRKSQDRPIEDSNHRERHRHRRELAGSRGENSGKRIANHAIGRGGCEAGRRGSRWLPWNPRHTRPGSHVWNGNIVCFTAKAMKKPNIIHMAACGLSGVPKKIRVLEGVDARHL